MGPYFFGNSYSDVQGAQQSSENSDRSFLVSLMAAQQRAQEMALQQQALQQSAAERQRQFNLDSLRTQYGIKSGIDSAEETKRANKVAEAQRDEQLGLGQDRLDAEIDRYNNKLTEFDKGIGQIGQPAADNFGSTLARREQARQQFDKAHADLEALNERGRTFQAQNLLQWNPKVKEWQAMRPDAPVLQRLASNLNQQLSQTKEQIRQAEVDAARAEQTFSDAARSAQRAGFQVDMQQGVLVHPKTGHAFSFLETVKNSQRVRRYNPANGKIEG